MYQRELNPQQKGKLKTLDFSRANFGRRGKALREMKQDKAVEEKATKEIESVQREMNAFPKSLQATQS